MQLMMMRFADCSPSLVIATRFSAFSLYLFVSLPDFCPLRFRKIAADNPRPMTHFGFASCQPLSPGGTLFLIVLGLPEDRRLTTRAR
ncbi:MAG: hypothetical protein JSV45_02435 [Chromatiales bacterium]|nr:MAG: hypothetical protein JSV45_02435 [Chromatiales bacterium]